MTAIPESPTGDHLGRTDKDFAIEFAGYLANATERFLDKLDDYLNSADDLNREWASLEAAIYEFRKRVPK